MVFDSAVCDKIIPLRALASIGASWRTREGTEIGFKMVKSV